MNDKQARPGEGPGRLDLVHDVARPSLDVRDEMLTLAALAGFEIKDLAGFALVAWDRQARPAVYTDLEASINPVPRELLPAFVFSTLQTWIARPTDDEPAAPA